MNAQAIHDEIIKLAQLQETALLRSMGIEDSVSDTESFEDESNLESVIGVILMKTIVTVKVVFPQYMVKAKLQMRDNHPTILLATQDLIQMTCPKMLLVL